MLGLFGFTVQHKTNYWSASLLSLFFFSASGTETVAVPQTDGSYKLHGFKWFTSATDADMTLTLARVQDRTGAITPVLPTSLTVIRWNKLLLCKMISRYCLCTCLPLQGSRGLSLFYAEVSRGEDGRLKGIEVQRLKDKLGTRQVPTAELLLDGLPAHRVSHTSTIVVMINFRAFSVVWLISTINAYFYIYVLYTLVV